MSYAIVCTLLGRPVAFPLVAEPVLFIQLVINGSLDVLVVVVVVTCLIVVVVVTCLIVVVLGFPIVVSFAVVVTFIVDDGVVVFAADAVVDCGGFGVADVLRVAPDVKYA